MIVLHYTAMASAEEAAARLCDPAAEVSSHYLIARDGSMHTLVPEELRAWHAGAGEWAGMDDVNSRSIGIELDNDGQSPFSEPLMNALEDLMYQIIQRWNIPPEGVIGHSDMAPGRKIDPGPRFDWVRLERQSLAHPRGTTEPTQPVTPDKFRALARRAGYTADVDDATLLTAVRQRYRPMAIGPLTSEDLIPLARRDLSA